MNVQQQPVLREDLVSNTDEDVVDLRFYWQIFNKYRGRIIMLTLLITVLAIMWSFLLTPIYRSTATLLIEPGESKIVSIEDLYNLGMRNDDYYRTQMEILKSRELVKRIVEKHNLASHKALDPEMNKSGFSWRSMLGGLLPMEEEEPMTPEEKKARVIENIMYELEVDPIRNTLLVKLSFDSPDAELAARVPNDLIAAYIEMDLESRLDMTKKAAFWLTEQVGELRNNLEKSEQALQDYVEKQSLVDAGGVREVASKQIESLSTDLIQARSKLAQTENIYRQIQALKGQSASALESTPAILNHPLVQSLKTAELEAERKVSELTTGFSQVRDRGQSIKTLESIPAVISNRLIQELVTVELKAESRVSELSKRYGPKHPTMLAAQSELESTRANTIKQMQRVIDAAQSELAAARTNTAKQVQQVIDSVTKEYEIAKANVSALGEVLKQKEDEREAHIQVVSRKEYQLGVLKRDVEVNRQLYDLFLTRFKETNVSKDLQSLQSTIGRTVDPAIIGEYPYKPNKKLIAMIALILGLIFATMIAFLLEYMDDTLKDSDDVEQKLGLPLLGTLPKIKLTKKKENIKPQLLFLEDEKSHFAESIRTIRTGIMLSGLDNPHKILVVTSSLAGEGKTTFSINQAFALGQLEKTVLIEADMRRPSIGKVFGIPAGTPGLSELVAGTKELSECVRPIEGSNIDLIPSGTVPPNPLELLSSPRFKDVLQLLEERYERIVIDSAPTHLVSDAFVLAKYATALVFVVRADLTSYRIVLEETRRLRYAGAPILGIVLNQLDFQKLARYYGYKYGYRRYYGRGYGGYYGRGSGGYYGRYGGYGQGYYGHDTDEKKTVDEKKAVKVS